MNNLIIFMTLTGSIPMLAYYLVRFLFRERIFAGRMMVLLYFSMFFFLLPFPLLANLLRSCISVETPSSGVPALELGSQKAVLISQYVVDLPRYSQLFCGVLLIWAGGFIFCLIRLLGGYRRFRRELEKSSVSKELIPIKTLFFQRKAEIRASRPGEPAFSTGIFHPVIILPSHLRGEERRCVLLHELAHVRNMDFLLRLLGLFIRALHWFNPFAHLLVRELKTQQEFRADESVLGQLDGDLQKKYGNLILCALTRSSCVSRQRSDFVSGFTALDYLEGKERIRRLKLGRTPIRKKTAAILAAAAAVVSFNCSAILGYQPPFVMTGAVSAKSDYLNFTPGPSDEVVMVESAAHFTIYPYYVIDKADTCTENMWSQVGSQIPLGYDQELYGPPCPRHNWIEGTVQSHESAGKGACDLVTSTAKRCSICGTIAVNQVVKVIHDEQCPHSEQQ